jgi:catechol 2,3-dioxygenase-like lactoylglutathione lyase family enzyme
MEAAVLLRIDHVGIACRNLDEAIARYESAFGLTVMSREENPEQGVREAMLQVGEGAGGPTWVQLLEPTGPDTPVGKFIARRGEGMHHVGYLDRGGADPPARSAPPARVDGCLDRVPAPGGPGRSAHRIGRAGRGLIYAVGREYPDM